MDMVTLTKFSAAFVFVLALMALLSWVMKRAGFAGVSMQSGGKRRLKIIEVLPVDSRRRLLLIKRDNKEHLIILGPQGETVIETDIPSAADNIIEFSKDQKNVQG